MVGREGTVMNLFVGAIAWIFSPERASGSLPLLEGIGSHLGFTFGALAIAVVLTVPVGWWIGHTGRGRDLAVAITGAARAVPSFGLVLLLVVLFGVTQKSSAAISAFVLLAIPTVLAGTYAGIESVSTQVVDAARAIGMTEVQVLFRVEVPLSLPLLVGGIRSALLQVVATVTLVGYIGNWGLGYYIIQGIQIRDYSEVFGASLLVVVLAVLLDALCALAARMVTPLALRPQFRSSTFARSTRG